MARVLHLFDRECSVQRRHQKVVEEAPAVLVPGGPRGRCGTRPSPRRRRSATSASGTVEYLVDASGFYFLEMNTRLQVEHGVTELVTGLDLVGLQLAVASGPPACPSPRRTSTVTGHAVEVRLCAERPREDYRPTPGTVDARALARGARAAHRPRHRVGQRGQPRLRLAGGQAHGPRRGPGGGRRRGCPWPCARSSSTAWRPTATCSGPCSTTRAFRRGDVDVHYLERPPGPAGRAAARRGAAPPRRRGGLLPAWTSAAARSLVPGARGRLAQRGPAAARRHAHATRGDAWRSAPRRPASRSGSWSTGRGSDVGPGARTRRRGASTSRRRGRAAPPLPGAALGRTAADVNGPEGQSTLRAAHRGRRRRARRRGRRVPRAAARAPSPRCSWRVGDVVAEGDGLVVLEAMKMEHTLRADGAGTVAAIHCAPGQQVDVDDLLVAVEPA